jgi:FkbM family methyltransferase
MRLVERTLHLMYSLLRILLRVLCGGKNWRNRFLMERYGRSGIGTASVFLHIWPYPIRFYVEPRIISNRFIHERQISFFLSKIKGEVFVDVGAYLGHYSLMLCSNFSKIFAFEPFPMNLKLLRQNVYYGKAKNVLCVGMAVSDKEGTTTLYSSFGGVSGGHSLLASETLPDSIKVKTCTLATFFKELPKIDLVKVDVEGAEWRVLKGAEPILDKIIAWIVELHDLQRKKEIQSWFASRGYRCKWLDFWHSSPNHIYAFREAFGANNDEKQSYVCNR